MLKGGQGQDLLELRTLGQFTARYKAAVISDKAGRSNMLWELFKYLLTNRGCHLSAESVLEILWPDKQYQDSRSVLKAQVHRLKKMLSESALGDDHLTITSAQGCYRLDLGRLCWMDTDLLEDLFNKANKLSASHPAEAMEAYRRLISLYRGDYLPEINSPWVFYARHNYLRIFLQSVYNLNSLYGHARMYLDAVRTCEEALQVVPFEEELHICYLQGLIDAGKKGEARAHYENITSRNYLETGAEPTVKMKNIYQQISHKNEKAELDLSNIQEMAVEGKKVEGAFNCRPDFFRFLYRLEKRRLDRKNSPILLGSLTLTGHHYSPPPSDILGAATASLKNIISASIRKGDVYTQWNEAQFLLLLPDLTPETGEKVLQRLNHKFEQEIASKELVLRCKLESLLG
ncbi:MAG TPA: hypothetical protein GX693_02535 [Firmicutes bacterium]|nr:hypothetical protein [Bacillota bacterium]